MKRESPERRRAVMPAKCCRFFCRREEEVDVEIEDNKAQAMDVFFFPLFSLVCLPFPLVARAPWSCPWA